jgi:hypothetical protein
MEKKNAPQEMLVRLRRSRCWKRDPAQRLPGQTGK